MVLVPAGCFMMGSNNGDADEQPVHQQCFEKPFWIDLTEVTNEQYGSVGHWSGDDRPREMISWIAASLYCRSRDGRLPSEVEWEYAARGPDNLKYPWGNTFVPANVVYNGNSGETTVVGSRLAGASWVGSLDMSGNVWEWTSTIYKDYPYDANDLRENLNDPDRRVFRGNGFSTPSTLIATSDRNFANRDMKFSYLGFRCARDY
jgi:iron(II)-dependent oxidoreductase